MKFVIWEDEDGEYRILRRNDSPSAQPSPAPVYRSVAIARSRQDAQEVARALNAQHEARSLREQVGG